MAIFQLDPESIVARAGAAGGAVRIPTLGESLARGGLGFMLVGIAGFLAWAASEFWLRSMGEMEIGALRSLAAVVPALFVPTVIGYLAGEGLAGSLGFDHHFAAMVGWGACYGLGLGFGLGLAFFLLQKAARGALAAEDRLR